MKKILVLILSGLSLCGCFSSDPYLCPDGCESDILKTKINTYKQQYPVGTKLYKEYSCKYYDEPEYLTITKHTTGNWYGENTHGVETQDSFIAYSDLGSYISTDECYNYQEERRLATEAEEKARKEAEARRQALKAEYEKCLKKANLCNNKKGCRINLDSGSLYNRVVSIAHNGVLVHIESVGDLIFSLFIGERANSNVFIYTDKEYTSDSSIDTDKYYEYVGTYTYTAIDGSTQRVPAYKETTISVCKEPNYNNL